MDRGYHERIVNIWRYKCLVTVVFLSTLTLAQSSGGDAAVCPLSESQTQKSIEAFAKIVPTLTEEPRCVNCHGGVNPFMDGFGEEPSPDLSDGAAEAPGSAPAPSLREHGGGKMDRRVQPSASNPRGSPPTDCKQCHNKLARKIPSGGESEWALAPTFLQFLGKDSTTLCKQIKDFARGCEKGECGPWPDAKKVLDHFVRDEGRDNFVGTAFMGNRGLTPEDEGEDFKLEPPRHITPASLIALVKGWVASTGGEFKGDKSCGCEPAHYAIRYSNQTKISLNQIEYGMGMDPVDIPLTFKDDGTFTGDGAGTNQSSGVAAGCSGQGGLSMKFHVTGKAIETSEKQSMHIGMGSPAPMAFNFTGQCPNEAADSIQANIPAAKVTATYDMKGEVGEAIDKTEDSTPGITNSLHLEIVKTDEPAP